MQQQVDPESLERATLAAVPPQARVEAGGWLLAFDDGTVGRAHSAAPLNHRAPGGGCVALVEAHYAAHALAPVWRLPRLPAFDALQGQLARGGYRSHKPTLTQVAAPAAMAAQPAAPPGATLSPRPGTDWQAAFLGEGFDTADAASRIGILLRAQDAMFGAVRIEGQIAAVGVACFAHGWCGVHGMRTAPAFRRRGLARQLLAAFGREALARGVGRAFLQVESGNAAAQSVYRRAGFATAWPYDYWSRATP